MFTRSCNKNLVRSEINSTYSTRPSTTTYGTILFFKTSTRHKIFSGKEVPFTLDRGLHLSPSPPRIAKEDVFSSTLLYKIGCFFYCLVQ